MSPSTPDLVCPWQWLKSTCPGLLWVSHLMKTSINTGTLQRTIWLCLLDCSPPYRSAHTECTVPNQLFIHFSHCSDRTSLRSLLQGGWGLMAYISGLKSFFHPNQTLSIIEPSHCPCSILCSGPPSCVCCEKMGVQFSTLLHRHETWLWLEPNFFSNLWPWQVG